MIGVFVEWDWLPNMGYRRGIAGHVIAENGCWEWVGRKSGGGYGQVIISGRHLLVHRLAYEHSVGVIPDGMQIDHICRNRKCVNPRHLRLVTPSQNVLENSTGLTAVNAAKTHCLQGHAYTDDNTRIVRRTDGRIRRQCRACDRESDRRRRLARAALAAARGGE